MRIRSLMVPDPITITEQASIEEAIGVMKTNSIRHLPVVTDRQRLRGFVTLADLKLGLIPSLLGTLSLSDLMVADPITVGPGRRCGNCRPADLQAQDRRHAVVQNGRVVGIITETDICGAFIDMMGILTASSRIDVVIADEPQSSKKRCKSSR